MLTNLSAMAKMERELTLERIKKGVPKAKLYDKNRLAGHHNRYRSALRNNMEDNDITTSAFTRVLGVSRTMLYKYMKVYETRTFYGQ